MTPKRKKKPEVEKKRKNKVKSCIMAREFTEEKVSGEETSNGP